jgi:hypothetical protein
MSHPIEQIALIVAASVISALIVDYLKAHWANHPANQGFLNGYDQTSTVL